jgi:hypothetical protein
MLSAKAATAWSLFLGDSIRENLALAWLEIIPRLISKSEFKFNNARACLMGFPKTRVSD